LIEKVLNHSNANTTAVYARLAEDAPRAALEELARRMTIASASEATQAKRAGARGTVEANIKAESRAPGRPLMSAGDETPMLDAAGIEGRAITQAAAPAQVLRTASWVMPPARGPWNG
jgi:hypothetical protein